jgi:hypothetical protein
VLCNGQSPFPCDIDAQWLETDFLAYLAEWKREVDSNRDLSASERAKLLLSRETLEGLTITGEFEFTGSSDLIYF